MANDLPPDLPRKKRSILWWLLGIVLILLTLFFYQLLGPNPTVIVSRETTHIVEPLGANGLPDYERYLLDQYRGDITPEENAAALLWKAVWPAELSPGEYAPIVKELGLAQTPSKAEAVMETYSKANTQRLAAWLVARSANAGTNGSVATVTAADANAPLGDMFDPNSPVQQAVEQIIDQAASRPWRSEQIPPLAQWVQENDKPMNWMVEASTLPKCYFPSTTILNNVREPLYMMSLAGVQGARQVSRSLPLRAMRHLGEGREMEAWQDILAIHQVARLVANGPTLVEQLIGIAIDGVACYSTQTLVHHGQLSATQLQQIRRDLAALRPFNGMSRAIDRGERLMVIETVVHMASANRLSVDSEMSELGGTLAGARAMQVVSVDWNLVLRELNRWYDRAASAAALPERVQRIAALNQLEADSQTLITEAQAPASLIMSAISRHRRSEVAAALLLGLFWPATSSFADAQDRGNVIMSMTEIAAALAEHRSIHDSYPDKLVELVPALWPQLPLDVFVGAPFVYKRDGDGYLLYSVGVNLIDEGGSNEAQEVHAGVTLSELEAKQADQLRPKIPTGADDIFLRLPRPALKIPTLTPPPPEP